MQNNKINAVFVFVVIAALLSFYLYQNSKKATLSLKKLSVITQSNAAQRMTLLVEGKEAASFDLPSSDIFDRSGKRQMNFKYLSADEFEMFSRAAEKIRVVLDGQRVEKSLFIRHENAFSFVLPNKHVFFVAPPHMQTAVYLLQQERKNKRDVFFCDGSEYFCDSVMISNFGGLTDRKDPDLKEDGFFNTSTSPAGRYMGWRTQYEIMSNKQQTVFFRLKLALPLKLTLNKNKRMSEVKVLLQVNGQPVKYRFEKKEGPYLFKPAVLYIMLPLNKGKNVLKMAFSKVLQASDKTPFDTTGVLVEMLYSDKPKFK